MKRCTKTCTATVLYLLKDKVSSMMVDRKILFIVDEFQYVEQHLLLEFVKKMT